jgi:hypothetical protein
MGHKTRRERQRVGTPLTSGIQSETLRHPFCKPATKAQLEGCKTRRAELANIALEEKVGSSITSHATETGHKIPENTSEVREPKRPQHAKTNGSRNNERTPERANKRRVKAAVVGRD